MALEPFVWGQGGQKLSPQEAARQREMAKALMGQNSTVAQNPWEGIAQVARATTGTVLDGRADAAEAEGRAELAQLLAGVGPDTDIATLMSVYGNGWANPQEQAIAELLINQDMKQSATAEERTYAAQQLAEQRAYEESQPLNINGQLVDRNSYEVLGDYRDPDALVPGGDETYFGNPVPFQDAEGNIQFGQIGNKGTFKPIDLGAGGGQFVSPTKTINTETEQIVMDNFGNVLSRMPIQNEQAAFDTAVGTGMGQAKVENVTGAPQAIANADTLLNQIDGVLADPALDQAIGLGGVLPAIPGTDQAGVVTRVEQLQGQAFLQAFDSLKGAGQITEVEGQKATAAIARLNRVQNKEDFVAALNDLREIVLAAQQRAATKGGVDLPERAPAAAPQSQANPATLGAPPSPSAGGVVDFSDYFR